MSELRRHIMMQQCGWPIGYTFIKGHALSSRNSLAALRTFRGSFVVLASQAIFLPTDMANYSLNIDGDIYVIPPVPYNYNFCHIACSSNYYVAFEVWDGVTNFGRIYEGDWIRDGELYLKNYRTRFLNIVLKNNANTSIMNDNIEDMGLVLEFYN